MGAINCCIDASGTVEDGSGRYFADCDELTVYVLGFVAVDMEAYSLPMECFSGVSHVENRVKESLQDGDDARRTCCSSGPSSPGMEEKCKPTPPCKCWLTIEK